MKAFIPGASEPLLALGKINADLISFVQQNSPSKFATIDIDATLVPTNKKEALYCYKNFKAYQPLNAWWDEDEKRQIYRRRKSNYGRC